MVNLCIYKFFWLLPNRVHLSEYLRELCYFNTSKTPQILTIQFSLLGNRQFFS